MYKLALQQKAAMLISFLALMTTIEYGKKLPVLPEYFMQVYNDFNMKTCMVLLACSCVVDPYS